MICPDCRFPFVLNGEGRDTANLVPAEIRTDGTALCGECAPRARADREKASRKKAKHLAALARKGFAVSSLGEGGYELGRQPAGDYNNRLAFPNLMAFLPRKPEEIT